MIRTGSKISARTVWPETMNEVPVKPLNTLNAMNISSFIAAAVPAEHAQSIEMARLCDVRRPTNLFMGPHMRDEYPMATRTPALEMLIVSTVISNSFAISGAAGRRQVLEKVTTRVIQLTTNVMTHFLHNGISRPFFSGSFCPLPSVVVVGFGDSVSPWPISVMGGLLVTERTLQMKIWNVVTQNTDVPDLRFMYTLSSACHTFRRDYVDSVLERR